MSGAGRGTPRISPFSGAVVFESPTLIPVNSEKFVSRILNSPANDLLLSSSYQNYVPSTLFAFPLGVIRGIMSIRYQEGAPGGAVDFYLRFGFAADLCTQSADSILSGNIQIVEMRKIAYRIRDTGDRYFQVPFIFPPSAATKTTVAVSAMESGVPGTPGTISILEILADNLAENSLLPTITD